jgi:ornithine cyclodeaminase/alanine dehydrogenase
MRVEMPPKPGIHPQPDAFIHAMPAFVPAMGAAGMKWVSGFPANQARGLPYINGLLILNDPDTGIPIMVSDCTWITAMRTGAASALAASYLARKDSRSIAIVGCGVQGRSNLEALLLVLPEANQVRAYDVKPEVSARYREWAQASFPERELDVVVCGSAEGAVRDADVVITSGPILKQASPVIRPDWFARGAFACPVDFDSYWTPAAMHSVDLFLTDDATQLAYYQKQGYFSDIPPLYADLGELVAGKKAGRTDADQRIIAMNLGLALEDMAVAVKIYARAKERGIGTRLAL